MLSAINHTLGYVQYPTPQQDDAVPQRTKRSIDETHSFLSDDNLGAEASDKPRRRGTGGMDSLGRGNLL